MKLIMRRGYPKTVPALVPPKHIVELCDFWGNCWFHESINKKTSSLNSSGISSTKVFCGICVIFDGTAGSIKLIMRRGYPKTVLPLVPPNNIVELVWFFYGTDGSMKPIMRKGYPKTVLVLVPPEILWNLCDFWWNCWLHETDIEKRL